MKQQREMKYDMAELRKDVKEEPESITETKSTWKQRKVTLMRTQEEAWRTGLRKMSRAKWK